MEASLKTSRFQQPLPLTVVSSAMHFMVDGLCVCCLYVLTAHLGTAFQADANLSETGGTMVGPAEPGGLARFLVLFITYNTLAFLTQPLTGWYADRAGAPHKPLLLSLLLLSLAVVTACLTPFLCSSSLPLLASVLLGLGNSLFHVWGGRQVAVATRNDMRALGTFVSTGAMGLAVGVVFSSWLLMGVFILSLCLTAAPIVLTGAGQALAGKPTQGKGNQGRQSRRLRAPLAVVSILAIMLFVMLRSSFSETFSSPLSHTEVMVLVIGLTAMTGKMAGGWMARHLGIMRALGLTLIAAGACHVFRHTGTLALLAGLFAVNCTMPVTLYLANLVLKGSEGLAFGLLAAALVPGYLLALLT